jgi:hypothetical protein
MIRAVVLTVPKIWINVSVMWDTFCGVSSGYCTSTMLSVHHAMASVLEWPNGVVEM